VAVRSRSPRALAAIALAAACSSSSADEEGPGGVSQQPCLSNRDFFAQRVWAPVMSKICLKCHGPDGVATDENAALYLLPSSYPGFLDANLDTVAEIAKTEYDGKSILLRKPLGEMDHGGQVQLTPDSAEYQALEELVARLAEPETCPEAPATAAFPDVALLDEVGTLRKAAIALCGRLPTAGELDRVRGKGDSELAAAIDELLREEAFFTRLKEIFNDQYLTDRYLGYTGYAVNVLDEEDFPNAGPKWFELQPEEDQRKINRAVAREPLELVAHVVREGRPFTEILTAKYGLVNPYSAKIYNVDPGFDDPTSEDEWKEVQFRQLLNGDWIEIPHAGVLSSPMVLNRFPTTPTNRNRARARMVYKLFLATDILTVAERPIDPFDASKYANPTRDDPTCVACHRQIDPIAGAFQKYGEYDQAEYDPTREWHDEMFPPGFGSAVMETTDYPEALGWLAERVVADDRFVLAAIYGVFQGLIGRAPLSYPADTEAVDYAHQLAAWDAEDATFRAIGEKFVASEHDLRVVFREIVMSPYFRARNATGPLAPEREIELAGVGTGRLLIPEVLDRKIRAVTGAGWVRGWDRYGWLTTDYSILYGGIDSNDVTERLTVPNGIMANVAWRMANEVACQSTAWDFTRPENERLLFPYVTPEHVPEAETGDAIPGSIDAIEKNVAYLHERILGESLPEGDPELERTYQLFYDTWKEGKQKLADGSIDSWMTWSCQGRVNAATGEDLPDSERISEDPDYVIRSWMAVLSYLLSDYRFLYE
jgi:hypothetical protein